jgi:hypothetical protein
VEVPLASQLGDERLKCQITKKCEISFENPIACFEELGGGNSQLPSDSFVAISEVRREDIGVYALGPLLSLKERSYSVKPRLVLPGKGEVRAMKARRQELLVGGAGGEVALYDLKSNDNVPTVYRYHREGVSDVGWLSLLDKEEERLFISASPENYLYMYFWRHAAGTNGWALPPSR